MGGGGSCGRFPFPVSNWKASTLLSGADFAKTTLLLGAMHQI